MSTYAKHNLYVGKYDPSGAWRTFEVPPSAQWVVRCKIAEDEEGGRFTSELAKGRPICLILHDDDFWPVMSFLSEEEAATLAAQLTQIVGYAETSTTVK
jgi:hypothetical protein